jgi:hypothetical protein
LVQTASPSVLFQSGLSQFLRKTYFQVAQGDKTI